MNAREIAYDVLREWKPRSPHVAKTLDKRISRTELSASDRALATELVHGVLRRRDTLSAVLKPHVNRPLNRVESGALTLLWLGASVLFGLAHIYDWRLVAGTIGLELVVILLYWRYRNLWPLGVLHGWMGALFYLWVLNVDMWDQAVVPFLEGLTG